ncbi:MAG: T9SS type A sorting domain-containing protein [Bacteroidia bacterium]|nr:T9SS type A sorting domain-containing protein [Bacteroidia bacterium]
MKKNVYLGIIALGTLAVAGGVSYFSMNAGETAYQPRVQEVEATQSNKGAFEYLNGLRANQYTGVVDPEEVRQARYEVEQFTKSHGKASYPFSWNFAGPDNIGGRTRGFLIDRNNNNILYAGGVMGGIFKSTNKGASWTPIDDQFEDMSVVSICQTVDGTIYFGTGESFTGGAGQEAATPGWSGGGIYKSTDDGATFAKIPQTAGYNFVNRVVAHPSKNIVFACTNAGLRASAENDDSQWNLVQAGNARDFVIDANGNALVFTNTVYRSTNPTQNGSYTAVQGIPVGGVSRIVMAVSDQDPNYVYLMVAGTVNFKGPTADVWTDAGLVGVYQSKDNGQNFDRIFGPASSFFAPLSVPRLVTAGNTRLIDGKTYNYCHSQGRYNLCIGVHPNDKERVFMGGINFFEWTPEAGPRIVGSNDDSKGNRFGIHADKHLISFDTVSNPPIMYICSDGGVAKTTNATLDNYTSLYNGYGTTQFYGIAAGTNGILVGGTQDNNTIVIDGNGNTPLSGVDVLGGDGFQCEVSVINPDIIFVESQNGNLRRSLNGGGNVAVFWDERIKDDMVSVRESDRLVLQANSIFNTPIQLWEDLVDSSSRMFYGLNEGVWMAHNPVTIPSPHWFRVAEVTFLPHMMQVSADGNNLFVSGTNSSTLSRISGFNKVTWDTADMPGNAISDSLTFVNINGNLPNGRSVTDIEVDQSNPNRVIVTLGNYGSSSHLYITENALDDEPVWRSIQGALPRMPVYDAEISVDNPDLIILGTEFGVFYAQNGNATTPTWTFNEDSMPRVPVLQMRQVEEKVFKSGARTGAVLYAGTHGRGIWKSSSLLTGIKPVSKSGPVLLKAYPNPVQNELSIEMPIRTSDKLTVRILNYNGQVQRTEVIRVTEATDAVRLDVATLSAGNYLISIEGEAHKGAAKFVKID